MHQSKNGILGKSGLRRRILGKLTGKENHLDFRQAAVTPPPHPRVLFIRLLIGTCVRDAPD
jgi:hypothetical protein